MAKILIFGGHGKVALLLAPLLVARGDEVTSVIRNPEQSAEVRDTGATPVIFDVEHETQEAFEKLLTGHDTIVWSAGAGGGSAQRTKAVDQDAATRSMDAAEDAGVRRYVMVSYFGASPDHGIDPSNSFFAYAQAKATADAHLRASALEWTVLGPSRLTLEEPTGSIDAAAVSSTEVSRANVAQVIAQTLLDQSTVGQTIRFNDGDQPIAQALADQNRLG